MEIILTITWYVSLKNVDVWLQDEACFGQQNTTTRLRATKGTRPRAVKQQQFEYAYLLVLFLPCNRRHQGINSANHEYGCDKHLLLIAQRTTHPDSFG
jgi:hypothetical protein